ncbi:alpha/beta fold hydrolase [uncultured Methylobacterium sp.]|uniref:alpha/beta fold hydrolase n=1 Tax=uncultured Methylobacterium sp. TaxID=157278 RepID=UPI0035CABABC
MSLVLVSGFMLDAGLWDDVAGPLSAAGPIVHADLSRDASIRAMAERLLAEAPGRVVLVGFSMGGTVAREAARIAPARVRGLALVATSARADTRAQAAAKRIAVERVEAGPFGGLSRSSIAAALHPDRAGDEGMIARVRAMGLRLGRDAFLRQSRLERGGDRDRLGAIACPTLVVAAGADRLRSVAESEELRDGIPGAVLRVVAESGHMLPIEAPGALTALLLDWLGALPP